ncbi:transmembrane protein 168 [Oryzias melastigma]|uniref:Transmembrane protein 168b n=1 Tax=Oryzias melastigma TaxID=30732 RepID=A0A3B3BGE0_ORYME|nr:transmembrane protein 168 [Oryzias melastigma]
MSRFLRYCTSHCLHAAMTRLEEVEGEVSMRSSVRFLGYLSGLTLLIALWLGLYSRWEATSESIFLVLLVLGVFVLVTAGVLNYIFNLERVSLSLLHLWYGFVLGLLSFASAPDLKFTSKDELTNYLLLFSVVLRFMWALLVRLLGPTRPAFLTSAERMELAGFAAASTLMPLRDIVSVAALVAALAALMAALRMNVYMAFVNLSFFVAFSLDFFKNLAISPNPFALTCFFGQLICDPLLDCYVCGLSVTERWRSFLLWRGLWRRLSLLPLLGVEVLFISLAGQVMAAQPQWYMILPFFLVLLLFWAICHMLFVITLWTFHSKLGDCQRLFHYQETSLDKIMASKGLRLFCLISGRLGFFTLASSFAFAAFCFQPKSTLITGVFLLAFTLESLFHGLFYELGNTLGGTCVGYAVVIPTNYCSPDGQPILLPPGQVQELNKRSTGMLNNIQRFFAHHLIENYGCDYSTSGLTFETLQAKINTFLEQRTQDGPRHDTYMIFYSGHTHRSGDWALAGGDTLPLHQILDWWREKNGGSSSRLVLVLDCDNALPWVKEVQQVKGVYAAVQGASLSMPADVELQDPPQLGDFTEQWVEYNCNPSSNIQWSERGRPVSAAYGISKHWSDYTLHLPTGSDLTNHWSGYFPRFSHPVVRLALWCGSRDALWICSSCVKCLKRWKLNWFPPAVLDTGQGFKLVRS